MKEASNLKRIIFFKPTNYQNQLYQTQIRQQHNSGHARSMSIFIIGDYINIQTSANIKPEHAIKGNNYQANDGINHGSCKFHVNDKSVSVSIVYSRDRQASLQARLRTQQAIIGQMMNQQSSKVAIIILNTQTVQGQQPLERFQSYIQLWNKNKKSVGNIDNLILALIETTGTTNMLTCFPKLLAENHILCLCLQSQLQPQLPEQATPTNQQNQNSTIATSLTDMFRIIYLTRNLRSQTVKQCQQLNNRLQTIMTTLRSKIQMLEKSVVIAFYCCWRARFWQAVVLVQQMVRYYECLVDQHRSKLKRQLFIQAKVIENKIKLQQLRIIKKILPQRNQNLNNNEGNLSQIAISSELMTNNTEQIKNEKKYLLISMFIQEKEQQCKQLMQQFILSIKNQEIEDRKYIENSNKLKKNVDELQKKLTEFKCVQKQQNQHQIQRQFQKSENFISNKLESQQELRKKKQFQQKMSMQLKQLKKLQSNLENSEQIAKQIGMKCKKLRKVPDLDKFEPFVQKQPLLLLIQHYIGLKYEQITKNNGDSLKKQQKNEQHGLKIDQKGNVSTFVEEQKQVISNGKTFQSIEKSQIYQQIVDLQHTIMDGVSKIKYVVKAYSHSMHDKQFNIDYFKFKLSISQQLKSVLTKNQLKFNKDKNKKLTASFI